MKKHAIIIGAGPAGLTAAYELITKTELIPILIEKNSQVGGISKTVTFQGNNIDLGGHRFFSKSDTIMDWWQEILPIQTATDEERIQYQNKSSSIKIKPNSAPIDPDAVMLIRPRKSRIYYMRKFFDYPVSFTLQTVLNLGLWKTFKIGISYIKAMLFPYREEKNLEQFFINRFGKELYLTFFKSYTEKVWGFSCREISAEWGAQRIKGLSIKKALYHFVSQLFFKHKQKNVETSLIEKFLYPKFGVGQMWEEVAKKNRR